MNVLVDPILLALPSISEGPEAFFRFLDNLLRWKDPIKDRQHDFVMSESCLLALYDSGRYPGTAGVRRVMAAHGIEQFDHRDVSIICDRIASNMPTLEHRINTYDTLLVDLETVRVDPDLVGRLPGPIADAMRDTLGHTAYAREVLHEPGALGLALLSRPITGGNAVQIDAVVTALEDQNEQSVATDVPLVVDPNDILRFERLQDIWEDTDQAIIWTEQELIRLGRISPSAEKVPYIIAPGFNDSIRAKHYDSQPDILMQIFWAVTELLTRSAGLRETHENKPLRGVANVTDNRGRDWEPWRKWVTRGTSAIRLHYWWLDGHYVISKVGPKQDHTIGSVRACNHVEFPH